MLSELGDIQPGSSITCLSLNSTLDPLQGTALQLNLISVLQELISYYIGRVFFIIIKYSALPIKLLLYYYNYLIRKGQTLI